MEYEFVQHQNNLEVFLQGQEYLKAIRDTRWNGKLDSKIYRNDTLLVESTFSLFLFFSTITVESQHLPTNISLVKQRWQYSLAYGDNVLNVSTQVFKNPVASIFKNGQVYGEVYKKSMGITLPPFECTIRFERKEEDNLYALIFYMVQLAPIY